MTRSRPYMWRELPDGRREVSWRPWVLIWVIPVLFLGAAALFVAEATWKLMATTPTTGTVVQVYAWPGETIFDRGVTNYGPVFEYAWSDGEMTRAGVGNSHPDWNFEVGSRHQILYFPGSKKNVVLPGPHNWFVAAVIGGIGAVLLAPALFAAHRLRRWRNSGRVLNDKRIKP